MVRDFGRVDSHFDCVNIILAQQEQADMDAEDEQNKNNGLNNPNSIEMDTFKTNTSGLLRHRQKLTLFL